MTIPEQILHLWKQGYDTHEISRRTGEREADVHREIILDRARRGADARQAGQRA